MTFLLVSQAVFVFLAKTTIEVCDFIDSDQKKMLFSLFIFLRLCYNAIIKVIC